MHNTVLATSSTVVLVYKLWPVRRRRRRRRRILSIPPRHRVTTEQSATTLNPAAEPALDDRPRAQATMAATPRPSRAATRAARTPTKAGSPRTPTRTTRSTGAKRVAKHSTDTPITPTSPSTPKRAERSKPHAASTRQQTPRRAQQTPTPLSTPRRAPASILRKPSVDALRSRTPKRPAEATPERGIVKKRIVGELAAKAAKPASAAGTSMVRSKSVATTKPSVEGVMTRAKSEGKMNKFSNKKIAEDTEEAPAVTDATPTKKRSAKTKKSSTPVANVTRTPKGVDDTREHKSDHGTDEGKMSSPDEKDGSKSAKQKRRVKFAKSTSELTPSTSNTTAKKSSKRINKSMQNSNVKTGTETVDRAERMLERSLGPQLAKPEKQGSRSKSKKVRPNAGRFDLRLPDIDGGEMIPTQNLKSVAHEDIDAEIPDSEEMDAEQNPSSARAEDRGRKGLHSSDQYVPLDPSKEPAGSDDPIEVDKLEAAKKKEQRKVKWKARRMRMEGTLPDSEGPAEKVGVMYLGHIPHGFYEKEMRAYFSQFGEVTRVRLSRSKKTARSRGYAFLEFANAEVAGIAAEAMDGYLMHGQALVAKVMAEDKVHPDTFKGANRSFKKIPWSSIERRAMMERAKDPLKLSMRSRRVKKSNQEKAKSLAKKGIVYDFPELA